MATTISYNDANIIARKKTWYSSAGGGYLETVRQGAALWIPINVTVNGTFVVNTNTANMMAAALANAQCPVYSIWDCRSPGDGITPYENLHSAFTIQQNTAGNPNTVTTNANGDGGSGILTNGGSNKNHLLMILVENIINLGTDRWTTPKVSFRFNSITFNGTCTSRAIGAGELPSHKLLVYGDSRCVGYISDYQDSANTSYAKQADGANTNTSFRQAWPWFLAQILGCELILDAFAGQGIASGASGCTWNGTNWTGGQTTPAAYAGGTDIAGGVGVTGPGPTWSKVPDGAGGVVSVLDGSNHYLDGIGSGDYIVDAHGRNDETLALFSPASSAGRRAAYIGWWTAIHAAGPNSTLLIISPWSQNDTSYADKLAAWQTYTGGGSQGYNDGYGPVYWLDISTLTPLGVRESVGGGLNAVHPNINAGDGIHGDMIANSMIAAAIAQQLQAAKGGGSGVKVFA